VLHSYTAPVLILEGDSLSPVLQLDVGFFELYFVQFVAPAATEACGEGAESSRESGFYLLGAWEQGRV